MTRFNLDHYLIHPDGAYYTGHARTLAEAFEARLIVERIV